MQKGYVQIYTGNGKGKTTAALGLALRSLCAGRRVLILQFLKGRETSELKAVCAFPSLRIEQFGTGQFIMNMPSEEDIDAARSGLARFSSEIASGAWDVVIADEINVAAHLKLFTVGEILEALKSRSRHTEVIMTGRYAADELIEAADLVTEMREIKHYWTKGVGERVGIES